MAVTASREAEWSDIDPNGQAFDYSRRDWARLVYAFGDAGTLVHPRYESYGRDLEAGRHIALPAPVPRAGPAGSAQTARALPPASTSAAAPTAPRAVTEPPVDYALDDGSDEN